jgi:hypothetical protein
MLAYVFWHWPAAGHSAAEYEGLQWAFHDALVQSAPAGFQRSFVFRLDGQAAWLGGAPAYADWYLVDGSPALDPLNTAAVSGGCEEPHARVAQAMAAGAGSLFGLYTERGEVASARCITFATKPRGMPYADFRIETGGLPCDSAWRRQMVLGPTPEFALLSRSPLPVSPALAPFSLTLSPVWPSA